MPTASRPYLDYYCSICERWKSRAMVTAAIWDSPRKCKKCGIYICPTCYKKFVKNDICPKCGGKLYIPSF